MGLTYKQAWLYRVLRQLQIKGPEELKLRHDLKKMTGHGLARLSVALKDASFKHLTPPGESSDL